MAFRKYPLKRISIFAVIAMLVLFGCTTEPDDRELETLVGHSAAVTALEFSPNGETLISAGEDSQIKLWDVRYIPSLAEGQICKNEGTIYQSCVSQNPVIPEELAISPITSTLTELSSVVVSPNGQEIAAGGEEFSLGGSFSRFDLEKGELLATYSGHLSRVTSIVYSPDGKMIAASDGDKLISGRISIWDVEKKTKIKTLSGHLSKVTSLAFSPDGKILASSGEDFYIILWDIETGEQIAKLDDEEAAINQIAFHNSGKYIASAGSLPGKGGVVRIWDIENKEKLFVLGGPSTDLLTLIFSHDGNRIFAGGKDNKIYVWGLGYEKAATSDQKDSFKPVLVETIKGHWGQINCLDLSPNGGILASGGSDNSVRLWAVDDISGESDNCNDGKDNDGDGWIDAKDPDCRDGKTEKGNTALVCNDGKDNDNDGYADAADIECLTGWDDDETKISLTDGDMDQAENTEAIENEVEADSELENELENEQE